MPSSVQDAILRQLRELIRIPSRAGVDDYAPVLDAVRAVLRAQSVSSERLVDGSRVVGICGRITGKGEGPTYMLNATVDTAPFGDTAAWTHGPLSADVAGGWLYGRGSADSKAGVAIFCHVLMALARERSRLRGSMAFLFDAEEHSGAFGGVRRFVSERLESLPLGGVMIGYPGHDRIVIGCRGFHRARLTVRGVAAHSGSSTRRGVNAVLRAGELARQLERARLPTGRDPQFPLPPEITVTAMHGGEGFSTVPDRCELSVDVRLTPAFTQVHAEAVLARVVERFDRKARALPATIVETVPGWPAYRLAADAPVYLALRAAAQRVLRRRVAGAVAGPSSIGNYLATIGVGATSGFGVRYRNLHAPDECVEVASIEPTYQTYLLAARSLLS